MVPGKLPDMKMSTLSVYVIMWCPCSWVRIILTKAELVLITNRRNIPVQNTSVNGGAKSYLRLLKYTGLMLDRKFNSEE